MFHRIMVPLDGSARASDAADLAAPLAERTGAALDLVQIQRSTLTDRDIEALDTQMGTQLQRLRAHGLHAHAHNEHGRPHETLLAVCAELRADLIVLAPHTRSRLSRILPLGMTEYLLVNSPVPLLVCPDREQGHPPRSFELLSGREGLVICPLDGSDVAERALPTAIAIAREFERTLLLVRVVPPLHGFAGGPKAYELLGEAQRDEEHAALHYLHSTRHRLAHEDDVRVETMLLSGDAADEILGLSLAHEASVVVMSTHGRNGLARVMIGSVAAEVIRRATVPVFVVPSARAFDESAHVRATEAAYAVPAAEQITSTMSAE